MTAYLQPGDKIVLAVPDFQPRNAIEEDRAHWGKVYEPLGIEIHHITVSPNLDHPVVVAVIRPPLVVIADERPL